MTAELLGRHTQMPVGHFTAFVGDLNPDLPTRLLWLPTLDEMDTLFEPTYEEPEPEPKEREQPPPSGSWAPITPDVLHAVVAGLRRKLQEHQPEGD